MNVWRSSFDNWLTEQAVASGAEVRDGISTISCEEQDELISVTLRGESSCMEQARYVINCEGVTGVLKRKLLGNSKDFITTFQTFNWGTIQLDPHYFYAYLQPELSEYDAWFNVKDEMLVLGVSVKDTSRIEHFYQRFISYMETHHHHSLPLVSGYYNSFIWRSHICKIVIIFLTDRGGLMEKRNNNFEFDFMPIGQAIRQARKARGMTREALLSPDACP